MARNEPTEPPWQAIREWISDDDAEQGFALFDQRAKAMTATARHFPSEMARLARIARLLP